MTLSSQSLPGGNQPEAGETVYERAGGEAAISRLVDAFYRRVEADPALRALFPDDLAEGKRAQKLFLTQLFGGPQTYSNERGHPRLRMRHAPFAIDEAAAAAWLGHMLDALLEADIPEPAVTEMRIYFERAAPALINWHGVPTELDVNG